MRSLSPPIFISTPEFDLTTTTFIWNGIYTHIRETKGHSRVIPTFFQHHSNGFPTFFLTGQILVFCPPSLLKGPNLTELLPSKYTPSFLMSRMPNRNSVFAVAGGPVNNRL